MEPHGADRLTSRDVELVADGLSVSARTVWRWLEVAPTTADASSGPGRHRFVVTTQLRERLAFWRGNVSAVHRELMDAQRAGSAEPAHAAPGDSGDVMPGDLAGLRRGELALRGYDVVLQRPTTHRNEMWEGDHVKAPVEVDVEGRAGQGRPGPE